MDKINKKSVALFDFDKTIYREYSAFSITKFLMEKNLIPSNSFDEMMVEYKEFKEGRLTYTQAASNLVKIQAKSYAGLRYGVALEEMKKFFEASRSSFYEYFEKILPELKKTHEIFLVTASPQVVAQVIKDMFNLDGFLSTVYEVVDGVFSGRVEKSLVDGKEMVRELLIGSPDGNNMAFGDSENDIGMLEMVNIPICVEPSPELLAVAQERGWLVVSDTDAYEKISDLLNI